MKSVSENVFRLLYEKGMSQKEFARRTGIAESTISDWKRKNTNPVSDKILIICEVLNTTPYELLSGAEGKGTRSRENSTFVIEKDSNLGQVVVKYQNMKEDQQKRVLGYIEAILEMER
ncbi:MAG: helix-turn-helix domain-containing protein [Blautia sp.]|nr:helix-turn-helix domain-containing protein [Blautia sp.]